MVGSFSPHEAFTIGGTNSVRGYEEGAVGSGRSYGVGSGEISFPLVRGVCYLFAMKMFPFLFIIPSLAANCSPFSHCSTISEIFSTSSTHILP